MIAKGQVIDSKTKETLPQATILVTDGNGEVIDGGKKTSGDKKGIFSIDVFPSDFLTISYVGYHNKTVSIKDFSSDINIINLIYNEEEESVKGLFKGDRGEKTDDGSLENQPVKWYYWAAFMVIGYYAYTRFKK
jgi:hypothetical protein